MREQGAGPVPLSPLQPTAASWVGSWESLGVQPAQIMMSLLKAPGWGSPSFPGTAKGQRLHGEPSSATAASCLQEPHGQRGLGRVIHLLSQRNKENRQLIKPWLRQEHGSAVPAVNIALPCRRLGMCRRPGTGAAQMFPREPGSGLFDEEESPAGGCLFL